MPNITLEKQGTPSITHLDVNTNLSRQYGCEAFEALSRSEKNDVRLDHSLKSLVVDC